VIRDAYIVLVGKPKGKRQFRKPKCRWEYKIELKFKKMYSVVGIDLVQVR
jgi:hypothetical protein